MKRIGLIASAFLLFAGVVAGAFYYLMPKLTLAETLPELHPGHAIASYAGQSEADAQSRKRTLELVEALGGVQDRIIGGDREAIADQSRLLSEIAGLSGISRRRIGTTRQAARAARRVVPILLLEIPDDFGNLRKQPALYCDRLAVAADNSILLAAQCLDEFKGALPRLRIRFGLTRIRGDRVARMELRQRFGSSLGIK